MLFEKLIAEYEAHLDKMLKCPPRKGSNYNVLTKAAGYFARQLSTEEKTFFLDLAQKYKSGEAQLDSPLSILKEWIIRFNELYLKMQTFLEPFPEKLSTFKGLSDSDERNYWK